MIIEAVSHNDLKPMKFRSTYILKPDLILLATSIYAYGWTSPVVVRASDMTIIDGHERVALAAENKQLRYMDTGVPVVKVDVDEIDAMIMHLTLNRARGEIVNTYFSKLLRRVHFSRKYDEDELIQRLGMSRSEFQILLDGSLIKTRKVPEHSYSKAWVPIESDRDEAPQVERPPNKEG